MKLTQVDKFFPVQNGIKNVHVEKGLYNCRDFTSSKIKDAIYYLDLYMEKNNDAGETFVA